MRDSNPYSKRRAITGWPIVAQAQEEINKIIRQEIHKIYNKMREEIESGASPPWPKVIYHKENKK